MTEREEAKREFYRNRHALVDAGEQNNGVIVYAKNSACSLNFGQEFREYAPGIHGHFYIAAYLLSNSY